TGRSRALSDVEGARDADGGTGGAALAIVRLGTIYPLVLKSLRSKRLERRGPGWGLMVLPAMRSIVRRRAFRPPHREGPACFGKGMVSAFRLVGRRGASAQSDLANIPTRVSRNQRCAGTVSLR